MQSENGPALRDPQAEPTVFAASRLHVRAIVAARRAEDRRRDIDEALDEALAVRREIENALGTLRLIENALGKSAEALDSCGLVLEMMLALACSVLPPPARKLLTDEARKITRTVGDLSGVVTRMTELLGRTTEQIGGDGAP